MRTSSSSSAGGSTSCGSGSSNGNAEIINEISEDEAQIYDRQIRLWGLEAQNRLRKSSILLVGMGGLGAEVSKNLMLSGLKSLTLLDDKEVSEADYTSQFMIPRDSLIKNRAEASRERVHILNPMVHLNVRTESVEKMKDAFFTEFDLVILLDQSYETNNRINKICRRNKIKFQAGGVYGHIGYAFSDFNNQSFLLPKVNPDDDLCTLDDDEDEGSSSAKLIKSNGSCQQIITLEADEDNKISKNVPFTSFEQTINADLSSKRFIRKRFAIPSSYYVIRALLHLTKDGGNFTLEALTEQWKKELSNAKQNEATQAIVEKDLPLFIDAPLNPVCAVVGSIIGQEAIKALSQNDVPLKSLFTYSTVESAGTVCDLTV